MRDKISNQPLSTEERERYSRQLLLPEIGESGQARLRESRVTVIGAGALGSAALYYLAAAGVGQLTVVDGDIIDTSNLQRQILHDTPSIGMRKVDSATERLAKLNPHVMIVAIAERLTPDNADAVLSETDFVIDATDNFAARHLINDSCVARVIPFCHGSISKYKGMVTTWIPGAPCYHCLFPEAPESEVAAGPFGAVAGVIGSLQAAEAIKYLTGIGETLTGRTLVADLLTMSFTTFSFSRDPDCPICGKKQ